MIGGERNRSILGRDEGNPGRIAQGAPSPTGSGVAYSRDFPYVQGVLGIVRGSARVGLRRR